MITMAPKCEAIYQSYIGPILIQENDNGIYAIRYLDAKSSQAFVQISPQISPLVQKCINQLNEYFEGRRQRFSIKLDTNTGTKFQRQVWKQLAQIPYGKTVSYKEIAQAIGNAKAVRAVGTAIGSNKLNIVVPCHRVVGSDGSLHGYGGGLDKKDWLLRLETRGMQATEA